MKKILILTVSLLFIAAGALCQVPVVNDIFPEGGEDLIRFEEIFEDPVFNHLAPEKSGLERLEDFINGRLFEAVPKNLSGDEISEGMTFILNEMWEDIRQSPRIGVCEQAAGNLAEQAALLAKNLNQAAGTGSVLNMSSPDGQPGETFHQETQTDEGCTVAIRVVWSKLKEAFVYLVDGICDGAGVSSPFSQRMVPLNSFKGMGGGETGTDSNNRHRNVRGRGLERELRDLNRGGYSGTRPDSKCREDSQKDDNVPPEPEPMELPQTGAMQGIETALCPACEPLLAEVNGFVNEINQLTNQMNELAADVAAKPFATDERNQLVQNWHTLSNQTEEIERLHDEALSRFHMCEITECRSLIEDAEDDPGVSSAGKLQFDLLNHLPERHTSCEECISAMEAVNSLIGDYNATVTAMNDLARSSRGLELGTKEGNEAYRAWGAFREKLETLNGPIQQADAGYTACLATNCASSRWDHFTYWNPESGACEPCKGDEAAYNAAVGELNAVLEKLNNLIELEREHVEEHGDAPGTPGHEALMDLLEEHDRSGLLRRERELSEKRNRLWIELGNCIREKCNPQDEQTPGTHLDPDAGAEQSPLSPPDSDEPPQTDPPADDDETAMSEDDPLLPLRVSYDYDRPTPFARAGVKLDGALRPKFKNAVCNQPGLISCSADSFTPVFIVFFEKSLLNLDFLNPGFDDIDLSVGAAFTRSNVNSQQNFLYGTSGNYPYQISGITKITGLEFYGHIAKSFNPFMNLPMSPAFSPYFRFGFVNFWNDGEFDFTSTEDNFSFKRDHSGPDFTVGLGTDIGFGTNFGTRINLDYSGGGADSNLRFGIGITYSF